MPETKRRSFDGIEEAFRPKSPWVKDIPSEVLRSIAKWKYWFLVDWL